VEVGKVIGFLLPREGTLLRRGERVEPKDGTEVIGAQLP